MRNLILGIVAILFAVTTAVAAEQAKTDSKKAKSTKKSTTVASSTSTTTATKSVKKIKEVKKVKSNFSGSVFTEFAHYFRKSPTFGDWQRMVIAPSISYSVPNTKIALGADVTIDNRANYTPDQEIYQEIDGASVNLYSPIWSNQSGTSVAGYTAYGMDFMSTVDGSWTKRTSNVYGALYVNQSVGDFKLQFNPAGYYYIQPNLVAKDTEQIAQLNFKATYSAHKKLSLWSKVRLERAFVAKRDEDNSGFLYLGASTSFDKVSITPFWKLAASLNKGDDPIGRQNYIQTSIIYVDVNYSF